MSPSMIGLGKDERTGSGRFCCPVLRKDTSHRQPSKDGPPAQEPKAATQADKFQQ